ncbi:MAG TPA: nucleotidyltransferase domain-containing protein [Ardenticatenaceae bacterium]|jgi:predicted nucleotidyltransferase
MLLQELSNKQLIHPPDFVLTNTMYLTMMGSVAYAVSSDTSDMDIYGFCIPPKAMLFPHLAGEIPGFGSPAPRFEQYQQHHVHDLTALAGKGRTYDLTIYGIVKYFQLCMENNPNMIDSLFTPQFCVLHTTQAGNMVRENRSLFLHKGAWHKFKNYAYSQLHKMTFKKPIGKRRETVEEYGYDVKFAYHTVRLLDEVEQILTEGTIDLQRNREQLKSIRRGEWTEEQVREWASDKERQLEEAYHRSELPPGPDEAHIKQLLIRCLEMHYGNLGEAISVPDLADATLEEIRRLLTLYEERRRMEREAGGTLPGQ